VLRVGKGGLPWAEAAVEDYGRRLRRWAKVEELVLKNEPFKGDIEAVRAAEGERILREVGARDRLVALDERGEDLRTDDFVGLIEAYTASGATGLVFAIGGPYGHAPAVRERAWRVVRLSSLVLNHELARVVLFEQLYRAFAIREGAPYHH
jgi:23S rRNA (pseudouridine1915-N3)-methyltransferase